MSLKSTLKNYLLMFILLPLSGTIYGQTYKDVAPVFYNRCTSCHHQGQHAFSLLTYTDAVNNAAGIVNALTDNTMPPWHPDTNYTRFTHERTMSQSEKDAILNWINNGLQAGDTTQAPPPPVYTSHYKLNGTPDLVLRIPVFTSNANNGDAYNCFSIPTGLTEDRWIYAYEIVPGNESIVHHVVTGVDSNGTSTSDLSGNCFNAKVGDFDLAVYAPGSMPTIFPHDGQLKTGVKLKAGSKIIMQLHYPDGSGGMQDSTSIRIFLYPAGTTGIRQMNITTPLQNWSLNIPANTVRSGTASSLLNQNISVFATFPHSHALATTMLVCAYKTTDTIPLIRINNWDFDWQGFYTFRKLVKVPSGYRLYAKHVFDNTTNNPHNPNNPPINVIAGPGTGDEMLFDSFHWLSYQTGDENYDIESIINSDPLLTGLAKTKTGSNWLFNSYIFPNPFKNSSTIIVTDNIDLNNCKLTLTDLNGASVHVKYTLTNNGFYLERGNLAKGTYIYKITTAGKSSYGRIIAE